MGCGEREWKWRQEDYVLSYIVEGGCIGGVLVLEEVAGHGGVVDVGGLRGGCESQSERCKTGELHCGKMFSVED